MVLLSPGCFRAIYPFNNQKGFFFFFLNEKTPLLVNSDISGGQHLAPRAGLAWQPEASLASLGVSRAGQGLVEGRQGKKQVGGPFAVLVPSFLPPDVSTPHPPS